MYSVGSIVVAGQAVGQSARATQTPSLPTGGTEGRGRVLLCCRCRSYGYVWYSPVTELLARGVERSESVKRKVRSTRRMTLHSNRWIRDDQ